MMKWSVMIHLKESVKVYMHSFVCFVFKSEEDLEEIPELPKPGKLMPLCESKS